MKRRLILASFLSSVLPGQDTLHGRWRSVTTTKGGIGAVYVFKPGGVVRYSSAVLLEMPFRLEGQILSLGDQVVGTGWHPAEGFHLTTFSARTGKQRSTSICAPSRAAINPFPRAAGERQYQAFRHEPSSPPAMKSPFNWTAATSTPSGAFD